MSTISVDYDVLNQRGSPAWFTDTFANIPTAGYVGRMFISKDTFAFYRDTGTGWDLIGGPGIGTLTGSGVVGQVSFFNGTQVLAGNNNLFWDNVNSRLGINTTTPGQSLDIHSTGNTLVQLNNTTTANSNISFQNQNVAKWRVGNVYNAGANSFDILNATTSTTALSISNTTNQITLISQLNGTSADFSSSVSALELLLDSVGTASATFVKNTSGTGVISTGSNQIGFNLNNAFFITSDNKGCSIFSFNHSSSTYTYTLPSANGTMALTSDLSSYLPLAGGTLTGNLTINPTNTGIIGLDVASNTTIIRSDNLEGFKRQLEIVMGSGTLVQLTAKGYGGNYITDLAFYTSTSGGTNASPGIYITGTNNRVGIKTGTPAYDLDVAGTLGVSSAATFSSSVTASNFLFTGTGAVLQASASVGTAAQYGYFSNTGGIFYFGKDDSAASTFGVGAYSTILWNSGNYPIVFATNNTGRMTIQSNGFVTIGGTAASRRLQVNTSGNDGIRIVSSNDNPVLDLMQTAAANANARNWRIVTNWDGWGTLDFQSGTTNTQDPATTRLSINGTNGVITFNNYGTGTITSTSGVLSAVSDMNLKIEDGYIQNALEKVLKLKPRYFYWKKESSLPTDLRQLGFYAQEVNEALGEESSPTPKENQNWGIYDRAIIAMLTKSIQELNEKLVKNNIN